jgi:hypothetical protein
MVWHGLREPGLRGSEKSLARFVSRYASEEVRRFLEQRNHEVEVRFREYDWRLNRR